MDTINCKGIEYTRIIKSIPGQNIYFQESVSEDGNISQGRERGIINIYDEIKYQPIGGIGYNFGRCHIGSCDFSLDIYSYVEQGDTDLSTFTLEPHSILTAIL